MAMALEEEVKPRINPPPCASPRPEGCAQCAAAIHCHDQRTGRKHIFWPAVTLGVVVVLAALASLF